ncbi:hypothetical protein HJC23_006219 [Cyclotella cryptica]|uniref:ABC transporter domain-containing protein n=1 Tax=Cyclotella cryptica TaxID=29204 RepID=A0ABD3PWZ1_9STRA
MLLCFAMLQRLVLILIPAWIIASVNASDHTSSDHRGSRGDLSEAGDDRDTTGTDDHQGGLWWSGLGVSFEPCEKHTCNEGRSDDSIWLLHPSSGFVEDGSLCGILGPSGAGKTTLLNALGGTTPRGSGVFITGSVWYEELLLSENTHNSRQGSHRRNLSQQDGDIAIVPGISEAKEKDATIKNNHKEVAQRKLSLLGLSSVADRRIGDRTKIGANTGGGGWIPKASKLISKVRRSGGLSGGERRRLSVALELITEPKIFLADEPTTGLDSAQAEKVVKLIAMLAKERSVPSICTLHQPKSTIWQTLDSFVLLAPGGKVCYAGKREDAVSYFKDLGYECPHDVNPSEYFIDLVTVDTEDLEQSTIDNKRIDVLHQRFLESSSTRNHTGPLSQKVRSNSLLLRKRRSISSMVRAQLNGIECISRRFYALLRRSWRQNSRNLQVNFIRLSASVVQAFLFSTIFSSIQEGKSVTKSIADRVALLTYGVINMSMMSLMKTLDLFARERGVVTREQMRNDYSSLEYLLAKVVAEMPLDAVFSWLFALVLKHLTSLRTSLADLAKTYCLMTVASVSLGFAIGSVTSTVESAMSVGVPTMVIFMIVGVINPSGVSSDDAPNFLMSFLRNLSPIRWAIEAVVTAEFRGMIFGDSDRGRWGKLKNLPKMGGLALVKDGDEVLANLGLADASYSDLMSNLALLSGVYLFTSWLGLCFCGPKFIDAAPNR